MGFSARLQLLTCLMLYATCAHAIMVKFGTKGGPIEPPPPEATLPPSQPYRTPAPVWDWEERSDDSPDPNAQWRPQLFLPQPRYTEVVYNPQTATPQQINSAQAFVNSYKPNPIQPIQAQPVRNSFTPSQILSSQSLPGFGLRYFVPTYLSNEKRELRQEDAKHNQVETNDVAGVNRESASDIQWKYEKDAAKRNIRRTLEASPLPYQWPAFVVRRYQ